MRFIADELATFAARTRYDDLPADVASSTKLLLLDSIGLALASAGETFAESFTNIARQWYAPGDCTVIGRGTGFSAPAAGMTNGVLIHGQDWDDTHPESLIHASSSIASAAFSLTQEHGLSGADTIRLAAVGYEVMVRVGLGATPGAYIHQRGFQGTSVAGAVAVAAMTAMASEFSVEQTRDAVALSTSVASGIIESTRDGSFGKGLQPGWAVQSGMWAAAVAGQGITGPIKAFEGSSGFYEAFAGLEHCDLERVTRDIGTTWEMRTMEFKLYPFCHFLQAHVDSALAIRNEARLESPDDVASVEVELPTGQEIRVCVPIEERLAPTSEYSLRFNLFYSIAMGLAGHARTYEDFTHALQDRAIGSLAHRVTYSAYDTDLFPKYMPGTIKVTMRDGRAFARDFASAPGPFGRPVASDEIEAKFAYNAGPKIGDERVAEIIAAVHELESAPDLSLLDITLTPVDVTR